MKSHTGKSHTGTSRQAPKRRVLLLCPFVPWPLDSGGRIRTFHLVREAQLAGEFEVELWCVADERDTAPLEHVLRRELRDVQIFPRSASTAWQQFTRAKLERWFHSAALASALAHRLANDPPDLLHVDEMSLMRSVPALTNCSVLVHHSKLDVEFHERVQGRALVSRFDRLKLRRLEDSAAARSPHHVVCSDVDRAILLARHPHLHIDVVPSGFDPEHFVPQPSVARDPNRVLVLGSLDYEPNIDGLAFFVKEVLPRLRANVRVEVVGRRPTARVRALCGGAVELVGEVDDVRSHLVRAAALVVPLRIGGGTRLKIAEALAASTPVVSTRIGAEGLPLDERHLWLADGADDFAAALDTVLADPASAAARAALGHDVATATLGWPSLARRLTAAWSSAIGAGAGAQSARPEHGSRHPSSTTLP